MDIGYSYGYGYGYGYDKDMVAVNRVIWVKLIEWCVAQTIFTPWGLPISYHLLPRTYFPLHHHHHHHHHHHRHHHDADFFLIAIEWVKLIHIWPLLTTVSNCNSWVESTQIGHWQLVQPKEGGLNCVCGEAALKPAHFQILILIIQISIIIIIIEYKKWGYQFCSK